VWWRGYKKYYFVFTDTTLSVYRSPASPELFTSINLKGCEVSADVSVTASRYVIKLFVPSTDSTSEMWLRMETEDQYCRWMAAVKLACRGRTMADTAAYNTELQTITSLVKLQRSNNQLPASPAGTMTSQSQLNIRPQDYVAPRFIHKIRTKQLVQRILDAHNNVCNLSLTDAKLNYIRTWQALPEHGITYFIVKFKGVRREDLLGVAYNRLVRLDMQSGDILRTWHYPNMKSWSVNWEIKQVNVSFEEEDLAFQCLTADCKVVHELIGGYIFLSMRSGDRSQTLNEELFHKLTGGWL
jgi:kindlin 2